MFWRAAVLVLCGSWAAWTEGAASGVCRSSGTRLSASAARNATGHLLATVRVDQEARQPSRPGPIAFDVQPLSTVCGNVRTDSLVVSLLGPPLLPHPEYKEIPGIGVYKYHDNNLMWEDAKASCESEDAHLLILNSEAEASAVSRVMIPQSQTNYVLAGFHDKLKKGQYVTIFGQKLEETGFKIWDSGRPTSSNNENCGAIHPRTGLLIDFQCNAQRTFICEFTS